MIPHVMSDKSEQVQSKLRKGGNGISHQELYIHGRQYTAVNTRPSTCHSHLCVSMMHEGFNFPSGKIFVSMRMDPTCILQRADRAVRYQPPGHDGADGRIGRFSKF